ncbi:hypothetical protein GIY30_14520 [Gordonia sp. HNM0687]|uniref:Uncharacterized protein n=1 Tax=Gordonia mangrovi TaxID=2665643 RepID=A0A6L7GRL2_9ACTN|nr:hypothetical protein [Gordonia mangrovi]MXP22556.1 hypothetical protein [Gordonia mangrovi]UVF77573.1 hypothetical protein NWF22_20215 [Gordonia mangrovi]
MSEPERHITLAGVADRADAVAFLGRALRLDDAAVVRLAARSDGLIGLWVTTGFDVLAARSVFGRQRPGDIVCDAASLRTSLLAASPGDQVDPGFAMESAWRGALPATGGFTQLDDVPARTVVELSRGGAHLARNEGSAHGPATGLLDQDVLEVSAADSERRASVSMRSLFALTAMGFIRDAQGGEVTETSPIDLIDAAEPVRIRLSGAWIRIDARFGSVFQRRERLSMTPR